MTIAIETTGLTRRHGEVAALDDVSVQIFTDTITGLLGRNGAGKTTFMALATAQDRATSGQVRLFGEEPFEHEKVLEKLCFIRDNQRYPDDYKLHHALRAAAIFYPNWSAELAEELVELFRIPKKTVVKKYSRGQFSSLGIVIGLASRAPITFFDEPYLGLDATARGYFYDVLLRDYAEHPRTIVLSTHLIDEMDRLLERVVILDQGKLITHADVDELRAGAFEVSGKSEAVSVFIEGRHVLSNRVVGAYATAVVQEALTPDAQVSARTHGVDLNPVSLQDLVAAYGVGEQDSSHSGEAIAGTSGITTNGADA